MESNKLSRGLRISTIGLRITTIICLVISLIILVTNVLRVPYSEDQVEIIHFYDVIGFKSMFAVIITVLVYSTWITVSSVSLMKNNRDPNILCVYYGEWFSSIMLLIGLVAGLASARDYHKWLRRWIGDDANSYDNYFLKSYASAILLLLALICTFSSSIIFSRLLSKMISVPSNNKKTSSKVNVVLDDQP